ncbi:hypothetical protein BL864_005185, partial [Escherichia coli]|nr:hypothetical protein [Escherichia coli]
MKTFIMDRRLLLKGMAASAAAGVALPYLGGRAFAQAANIDAYKAAKIDWRQAEGENITVAVIPAG